MPPQFHAPSIAVFSPFPRNVAGEVRHITLRATQKKLKLILVEYEPPPVALGIVSSQERLLSARVRVVMEWAWESLCAEFDKSQGLRRVRSAPGVHVASEKPTSCNRRNCSIILNLHHLTTGVDT